MTEHQDTTPEPTSERPGRVGAITRAAVAVAVGIGYGYCTNDVGQALTATGVALSLLREAFGRPSR
ncbi:MULTISPECIES: hypothetical protein [Mycobacterium avium complex (MAC)]|uniref:Uncharacterized protein n=1 Tax=Mycobacterium colombiense TaxID=339268 RepID=A0A329LVU5_9MYCO|nr:MULTISPECIES: hypothetical protein [Mycobacterium avium complex (MAC)]OBG17936.1 hypothetical protein A5769_13200 [Mycobacterium intracellulare]RAV08847.1 hypothetical protein DQP57_16175 [Mycobacterium colombiense]